MAQNYCDTEKLEQTWFNWILAKSLQYDAEIFRRNSVLYTKTLGKSCDNNGIPIIKNSVTLDDPSFPCKIHCLALPRPIVFYSEHGHVQEYIQGVKSETVLNAAKNNLALSEDVDFINPGYPLFQIERLVPFLLQNGFVREMPIKETWDSMLSAIRDICQGISRKFSLKDDDEHEDLASEAYIQVLKKLDTGKLVYTPGRAPVFNLLTTTIFRCMYSILNRKNNERSKIAKLLIMAQEGSHTNIRSLRTHTGSKHIRP